MLLIILSIIFLLFGISYIFIFSDNRKYIETYLIPVFIIFCFVSGLFAGGAFGMYVEKQKENIMSNKEIIYTDSTFTILKNNKTN